MGVDSTWTSHISDKHTLLITLYAPVVDEDVRNTQTSYQETSRPLCLEADSDHNTGAETDEGDDKTEDAELTLEDESDEQEDEENSACQLETESNVSAC
jgi:hypothetical protein